MEIYIFGAIGLILLLIFSWFEASRPKPVPYLIQPVLVNKSEKIFYKMLAEKIPATHMLLAKVRIEDFVGVNKKMDNREVWRHRGYVKSRHVDFLICEKESSNPVLAIELDGGSHFSAAVKKRDRRVNSIYKQAGLNVLHVRVGSKFDQVIAGIIDNLAI